MLVDANPIEHFPLPAPQHHNQPQVPGEINHHLLEAGRSAGEGQSSDILTYSQYVNGSIFSIPKGWSQKSTDELLMTVYSFVKTFCASGAGQGSIDNRIEQAMDLVKSHLMSAVRSEVEELKDKIAKLEDNLQTCQMENSYLRTNTTPEVLANMPNFAQRGLPGPQHLNSLPAPEPAHPALQPPQH